LPEGEGSEVARQIRAVKWLLRMIIKKGLAFLHELRLCAAPTKVLSWVAIANK